MNTADLTRRNCVPCKGGRPPMDGYAIENYMQLLGGNWRLIAQQKIEKEYSFPDFVTALAFTNTIGALAEQHGHHPDLELGWGRVKVTLWTHKIGGLSESDFIMAAHIDKAAS